MLQKPECIKIHHFEGEHAKIFLGGGTAPTQIPPPWGGDTVRTSPDTTLVGAFSASIRVPLALDPQTTFLDTSLNENIYNIRSDQIPVFYKLYVHYD